MSRWSRYAIAIPTAPLSGAAVVLVVTLVALSGWFHEVSDVLRDQFAVAIVLMLLTYNLLVLAVAVIGLIAVASRWRSVWIHLGIGFGLGLAAAGVAAWSMGGGDAEETVTISALPFVGVATSYSFWRIVFRDTSLRRRGA